MADKTAKLAALPYVGGKSPIGGYGHGRKVAELLPYDKIYVEPFAGMLGVFLQRNPSRVEVVNDLDGDVTNWWEVIRDHYEPFLEKLWRVPLLTEFTVRWATEILETSKDPIDRAIAFTAHCISTYPGNSYYKLGTNERSRGLPEKAVRDLAARMSLVQILSIDAVKLLKKYERFSNAVIYVDPPYRSSATGVSLYKAEVADWEALSETLAAQPGKVAVSGYNDEWDHLGWRVSEIKTATTAAVQKTRASGKSPKRVEKVWMNYQPAKETV